MAPKLPRHLSCTSYDLVTKRARFSYRKNLHVPCFFFDKTHEWKSFLDSLERHCSHLGVSQYHRTMPPAQQNTHMKLCLSYKSYSHFQWLLMSRCPLDYPCLALGQWNASVCMPHTLPTNWYIQILEIEGHNWHNLTRHSIATSIELEKLYYKAAQIYQAWKWESIAEVICINIEHCMLWYRWCV